MNKTKKQHIQKTKNMTQIIAALAKERKREMHANLSGQTRAFNCLLKLWL